MLNGCELLIENKRSKEKWEVQKEVEVELKKSESVMEWINQAKIREEKRHSRTKI